MLKKMDSFFFPTDENSYWPISEKLKGYAACIGVIGYIAFIYWVIT